MGNRYGNQQVTSAGPDGLGDDVTTNVPETSPRDLQGVVGIPGLNTSVPFQVEDWKLRAFVGTRYSPCLRSVTATDFLDPPWLPHNCPACTFHRGRTEYRHSDLLRIQHRNGWPNQYGQQSKITRGTPRDQGKIGLPQIDENGRLCQLVRSSWRWKSKPRNSTRLRATPTKGNPPRQKDSRGQVGRHRSGRRDHCPGGTAGGTGRFDRVQVQFVKRHSLLGEKFFRPKTVKAYGTAYFPETHDHEAWFQ